MCVIGFRVIVVVLVYVRVCMGIYMCVNVYMYEYVHVCVHVCVCVCVCLLFAHSFPPFCSFCILRGYVELTLAQEVGRMAE